MMSTKTLLTFVILALLSAHINAQNAIYNVIDFGAKGDGVTNDQVAIQKAIDQCKTTGGTVVLKNGKFLSGQLMLTSNMTLHIDSTATLLGIQSDAETAYPHHVIEVKFPNRMEQDCQRRLLYGNQVSNVTITGGGTIDGQGDFDPWMNVKELGTEKDRPSLIAFVGSKNIRVENLKMIEPACWTQVYIESDSITLSNLTINTGKLSPNRDGIDIVDCHHVLVENCDIKSQDDGICFKSGSEYGVRDVVVRNCTIDKLNVKAGNCFKLGTDGLGRFMNFDISGLTLKNAFQNSAIVIESMDGAVIDNMNISDCTIDNCGQAFFILLADRGRTVRNRPKRIGSISNIYFQNIIGTNFTQQYPSIITGIPGHNIQNVNFNNIQLTTRGGIKNDQQTVMEYDGKYPEGSKFGHTNASGFFVRHVDEISFTNCDFQTEQPDERDWLITEDVQVKIEN